MECWSIGVMGPNTPLLQHSITPVHSHAAVRFAYFCGFLWNSSRHSFEQKQKLCAWYLQLASGPSGFKAWPQTAHFSILDSFPTANDRRTERKTLALPGRVPAGRTYYLPPATEDL